MSASGRVLPFQSATEWLRFFEDNPEQDEYTWVGGQKIRFSDILRSLQQSKGADTKQIGDELHDILAASLLECNCDESSKCTACRIDDLAHRLSPFAEGGTVQAQGSAPADLQQVLADYEDGKGSDTQFRDAVRSHRCHTGQALGEQCNSH